MIGDILDSIISIIFWIIIIVGAVAISIKVLGIIFLIIDRIVHEIFGGIGDSIELSLKLGRIVLTVIFTFIILIGVLWFIAPSSFYLKLNTNNHDFEVGMPVIAVPGTYVDTDNGYIIRPTFGLPVPVIPGFQIQKRDKSHINLTLIPFVNTQFVNTQFDKNIKHPHNQNGVIIFVPDRGYNISNFSNFGHNYSTG